MINKLSVKIIYYLNEKMNKLQKIVDRLCDTFPSEIEFEFKLTHSDGTKSIISKIIKLFYIIDFPLEIIVEISDYLTITFILNK